MRRINFIGMLTAAFILTSFSLFAIGAMAQDVFPSKDITLICNSPPGGGFDIFARMIAPYMTKYLKELSPGAKGGEIKVKNMSGASGLQAYEYLFKDAKPDGYTFGDFNSGTLYTLLYGSQKVAFEPKDFTWLYSISRVVRVFIGSKKGLATWEELVAKSKKEPLTIIFPQFGGLAHLDTIYAVEITRLPAKIVAMEGTADVVSAVIRGDADAALVSYDSVSTICESKEVNTLVSFTEERILPYVPTIVEKGSPECLKYMRAANRHYMGPPNLDPERERLLIAAGRKMFADSGFLDFCKQRKTDLAPLFGKEVKEDIKNQIENMVKWTPIFKKYGL